MGWNRKQARAAGWCPDCGAQLEGGDCPECDSASSESTSGAARSTNAKIGQVLAVSDALVVGELEGRPPRKRDGVHGIDANQRAKEVIEWTVRPALLESAHGWPSAAPWALSVVAVYPDRRTADLANVVKIIEDGLTGVVWQDDRQVLAYREPTELHPDCSVEDGRTLFACQRLEGRRL